MTYTTPRGHIFLVYCTECLFPINNKNLQNNTNMCIAICFDQFVDRKCRSASHIEQSKSMKWRYDRHTTTSIQHITICKHKVKSHLTHDKTRTSRRLVCVHFVMCNFSHVYLIFTTQIFSPAFSLAQSVLFLWPSWTHLQPANNKMSAFQKWGFCYSNARARTQTHTQTWCDWKHDHLLFLTISCTATNSQTT